MKPVIINELVRCLTEFHVPTPQLINLMFLLTSNTGWGRFFFNAKLDYYEGYQEKTNECVVAKWLRHRTWNQRVADSLQSFGSTLSILSLKVIDSVFSPSDETKT